jgi:hypothetical protein
MHTYYGETIVFDENRTGRSYECKYHTHSMWVSFEDELRSADSLLVRIKHGECTFFSNIQ